MPATTLFMLERTGAGDTESIRILEKVRNVLSGIESSTYTEIHTIDSGHHVEQTQ